MSPRSLARQMVANASAALASQAALAVLGLVATAVFVRTLGASRFGAWSLVGAIVAYLGLLDFGLGVALVRRIASARGEAAGGEIAQAAGAALGVLSLLAVAAAVLVMLLAEPLADLLRVAAADRDGFVVATRIAAVGAGLALPSAALGAVPTAFQRLDAVVRLEMAVVALTLLVQVPLVLAGTGLVGLATAFTAGRAVSLAGRAWLARRLVGRLSWRFDPRYPFWRELGRFGTLKLAHQISSQLVLYLDRVLVGLMVSVEAVAYYTVAVELAQRLLVVQGNISIAFYPAACAMAHDRAALTRLYVRTSRVVALLTLPVGLALALLASPVLRVWVGEGFVAPSSDLLRVVALAYAAMALTGIPAGVADALNRPELAVRYSLAGLLINLALALLLIPPLGVMGAGLAVAGNVALQSPWFVRRVTADVVGISSRGYARDAVLEPLLPALASGVAIGLAFAAGTGRGATGLAAAALAGALAFAASTRLLGTLDAEERRFVADLPGGRVLQWVVGR